MKKTGVLILLAGSMLFFANCHKKVYPVSTKDKTATQATGTTGVAGGATEVVGSTEAQRVQGRTIFVDRCGKCHDLPKPEEYTIHAWDDILPKMYSKINLTREQEVMVRAYVNANAKQG